MANTAEGSDWRRVSQPAERYVRYLDAARRGRVIARLKQDTIGWLELSAGDRVLEVGCGTGDDVIAMGSLVSPRGLAVGLDILPTMVEQARARADGRSLSVKVLVADALDPPFQSRSFDACRMERTLQHTEDPERVVHEAVRLLKPGGRVVATEPDWETLVVDSPYAEVGRAIIWNRIRQSRGRDVGRRVFGLFVSAGLNDVRVEGRLVPYLTYEEADFFFHGLERAANEATREGVVTPADASSWIEALKQADKEGRFFFGVTLFSVFGRK